ncbi:MAG: YkgJ family cysteine cluster protein [Caldilineaceae bacterium]
MSDPLNEVITEAYGMRQAEREQALRILSKKKSRARLIELVDEAVGLAEMEISQISMFRTACEAGCAWCCYQRVSASPAEVLRIADYLRRTCSPEELDDLRARLTATDAHTRGLSTQDRLALRVLCPLLVDGRCSIYHVRPLTCRGYTSSDVDACRRKVDEPETHVHIDADPIRYFFCQGVLNGIDDGLLANELEGGLVELIAALSIALNDDGALLRWLRGDRVFTGAGVAPVV